MEGGDRGWGGDAAALLTSLVRASSHEVLHRLMSQVCWIRGTLTPMESRSPPPPPAPPRLLTSNKPQDGAARVTWVTSRGTRGRADRGRRPDPVPQAQDVGTPWGGVIVPGAAWVEVPLASRGRGHDRPKGPGDRPLPQAGAIRTPARESAARRSRPAWHTSEGWEPTPRTGPAHTLLPCFQYVSSIDGRDVAQFSHPRVCDDGILLHGALPSDGVLPGR